MNDVNKIIDFPKCDVCGAGVQGTRFSCDKTGMLVGACCLNEFRYAGYVLNKAVKNNWQENMDCGTGGYRHPQPGDFAK